MNEVSQRPWYRNTTAGVTLFGLILAALTGAIQLIRNTTEPMTREVAVGILVDYSAKPFLGLSESQRKLAIYDTLARAVATTASTDYISLRTFGGACLDPAKPLLIGFTDATLATLRNAIAATVTVGERTLIKGVLEASGDFSAAQVAKSKIRRVIVITGGADTCTEIYGGNQAAALMLSQRLTRLEVKAEILIVGAGVPDIERAALEELAFATGAVLRYASSTKELETLLSEARNLPASRTFSSLATLQPSPQSSNVQQASSATVLSIPSRQAAESNQPPLPEQPKVNKTQTSRAEEKLNSAAEPTSRYTGIGIGRSLSESLQSDAWKAFKIKDYVTVIEICNRMFTEFEIIAEQAERTLVLSKAAQVRRGQVSETEITAAFDRVPLNDVGGCYYIVGRSAEALQKPDLARDAYMKALRLTYARVWDPSPPGFFWSPAEAAGARLTTLK